MKKIVIIIVALISSFGFAQQSGVISGKLMDAEFNNEGLEFANVAIKGSEFTTSTDTEGFFKFENLKDGLYTLVCSFTGYETKEITANVFSGKVTEIIYALSATTISLDDFVAIASIEDKPLSASK